MNERKKYSNSEGSWTITPEVPSIELNQNIFEIEFLHKDDKEELIPGKKLEIVWINRINYTMGVKIDGEPFRE